MKWLETNGWVFALYLIMITFYWHAHLNLLEEKNFYLGTVEKLDTEKKLLIAQQEFLHCQIHNFENPEWIEWNLMLNLGLTPEGSTKVIIQKESAN